MSFGSLQFRGSFLGSFAGTFGRGIVSLINWSLRLATSYTADAGSDAVNSSTAQKVVEAFDATTGLVLVTVPNVSLTAPVPALRLSYDTDEGAVSGTELVTNGTFDTDLSGWLANNFSFDNGTARYNGSSSDALEQNLTSITLGSTYQINYEITSAVDSVGFLVNFVTVSSLPVGSHTYTWLANQTNLRLGFRKTGEIFNIDNVSVKQITPLFLNSVSAADATLLHPVNAAGEMKLIPWRLDTTAYALDDEIVTKVGVHNHYYVCTTAGTTAASAPTYTASGVQPLDGSAVFTYAGRYSNKATSTINHIPAVLTEKVATQQLLNSDVTATQTTGSLATGDYVLWQNGSGSSDLTAGTATISTTGSATDGSPLTFTVSGAGTVTVTITGGPPDEFQLEGGSIRQALSQAPEQ